MDTVTSERPPFAKTMLSPGRSSLTPLKVPPGVLKAVLDKKHRPRGTAPLGWLIPLLNCKDLSVKSEFWSTAEKRVTSFLNCCTSYLNRKSSYCWGYTGAIPAQRQKTAMSGDRVFRVSTGLATFSNNFHRVIIFSTMESINLG
mmetsp:Transcript_37351/g.112926  ORF Transcript_37351/g.112926 Transcript_37351/m.112926 type:complete len:144 (-) Transcript_37351:55-486(-)